MNILHTEKCSGQYVISVVRDPCSGEVTDFVEQKLDPGTTGTHAKNSSSMKRALAPPDSSFRGSAANYPFWPGGFDLPAVQVNEDLDELNFSPENLLHCPPGFDHGIDFYKLQKEQTGETKTSSSVSEAENVVLSNKINLADILDLNDAVLNMFKDDEDKKSNVATNPAANLGNDDDFSVQHLNEVQVLPISDGAPQSQPRVTKWAEMLDTDAPLADFHQQVPQMAFQWPFELDTFQKQAVLKLEQSESVFVAAHTSAGKTVVAEYAIALSQKHMTRTIYTSPIKALSNQKFRDFKDTFNDSFNNFFNDF